MITILLIALLASTLNATFSKKQLALQKKDMAAADLKCQQALNTAQGTAIRYRTAKQRQQTEQAHKYLKQIPDTLKAVEAACYIPKIQEDLTESCKICDEIHNCRAAHRNLCLQFVR